MGLDGGTKVTRADVLRGQSWRVASQDASRSTRGGSMSTSTASADAPRPADEQMAERLASWTTCSISGETLKPPVVADALGRLFSKDNVVEYLLAKKDVFLEGQASVLKYANHLRTAPKGAFDHIRGLRDTFEVRLQGAPPDTAAQQQQQSTGYVQPTPHFCPVTGLPCIRFPFSALRGCGCVLSDRALSMVGTEGDALACPACGAPYSPGDKVAINGTPEQVEAARARLQAARAEGSSKKRRGDEQAQGAKKPRDKTGGS